MQVCFYYCVYFCSFKFTLFSCYFINSNYIRFSFAVSFDLLCQPLLQLVIPYISQNSFQKHPDREPSTILW